MHINKLGIVPDWHFQDAQGRQLHSRLLSLLAAIHEHGRLTAAAKAVGLSYRHAWNILNESQVLMGTALVFMEKGRGAHLSVLGRTLLQFNQRVEARLHPQVESLSTELNVELHRAMADLTPIVRVFASHGYAVAQIPDYAQDCRIEMQYHTPVDALQALNAGVCKIAGFHQSIGVEVETLNNSYRELLNPEKFGIIRFIRRRQGLIFARDKPVRGLDDLADSALRFINRQLKSGTRELFDQLLINAAIDPSRVQGYANQEFTHSAVAAHIASNMADVGFGVEAAAHRFGLGFLPVLEEYYLWAYPLASAEDPEILAFLKTLQNPAFQEAVNQLPGYTCDCCGKTVGVDWLLSTQERGVK